MIILDTNVLSELTRPSPSQDVINWLDEQAAVDVRTTAITAAEMLAGVARLPGGRRRDLLADRVHGLLYVDLDQRIEPFDLDAAEQYPQVVCARLRSGRPVGVADAQIAAICRKFDASLATRNTKDFELTGVELLDPWRAG